MTDRGAVALALAAAAVAFAAPPVPPAAALLFVAAWVVLRRPALLAVALLLLVGGRAQDAAAALAAPLPTRVDAVAELASDPEPQRFGLRFVARAEGRRYLVEVPHEQAAAVRDLLTGERVHLVGRPRPLRNAPAGWVKSQHLAGRLAARSVTEVDRGHAWYRLANAVHRTMAAGSASLGERRPLYLGLVIGDDRGQGDLRRFRFEAAGLTHLLAVSGSNVAFVLAVAAPLVRRLERHARLAVSGVVLVLFALVTRAEPSVLRAAVMAAVVLVAVTLGRVAPGTRVLAVAVVLLLLADPLLVHSLGFQLSVAATGGLLVLTRPILERLRGPTWLTAPLAVTLAAQVATAPLLLWLNGGLPSVAVVANLLAGPAAGAVMVLGVTAGLLAGLVGDGAAALLQVPARALVWWVDAVATWSAAAPAPVLGVTELALLAALGAVVASLRRQRRRGRPAHLHAVGLVALAAVLVVAWPSGPGAGPPRSLANGATLHVGGCGGRVLVMAGASDVRGTLRELWLLGVRGVDVLVVGPSRSDASAAALLREQLPVAASVTTAERGAPGLEPLEGRTLAVGGLLISSDAASSTPSVRADPGVLEGPAAPAEAADGRCSVGA